MINPLSEKTWKDICQNWANVINVPGDNALYIWYPIGGMHLRIRQFLADTHMRAKLIISPSQRLILLDFQDRETVHPADFEEQIGFELHVLSTKPFFFEEWLAKHSDPIAIFVIGLDTSIKNGNHHIFSYLNKLANMHSHLSLLICTELDLPENKKLNQDIDLQISLFQKILYQPLYSPDDSMQFYKYLEEKWQFTLPSSLLPLLIDKIGNHYLLLKETARILYANPKADIDIILQRESLKKKGVAIFEKLSLANQQTIVQLLQQEKPKAISDYLIKTGLVEYGEVQLPYWEYIKNDLIPTHKEQNIDLLLTAPERDVFELLQETKDVVTREKIATSIWQDSWEQKYSDWAIDQLIHRIREKLGKTNAPYQIVTKKGEGFYLQTI